MFRSALLSLMLFFLVLTGCKLQPETMPDPVPPAPASDISMLRESPPQDPVVQAGLQPEDEVVTPPPPSTGTFDVAAATAPLGPPPPPRSQTAETGTTTTAEPSVPLPDIRTYEVQKGDTLWVISVREYGDGLRWKDIADANPGVDPKKMSIGTLLVIPD